ncbi:MAG: rhodanese-like domain-containing protein [Steroidobacteraceae bacterium]
MDRLIQYVSHHPLLAAAAAVAAVLVIAYEARLRAHGALTVSPQELIRLMNQGALVLDIRPPEKYAAGHISGARQLASDQIIRASDAFKRHKSKPVVVYCDAGSLAVSAARQLTRQGFTQAFTLRGGLSAWRAENLPLSKP